MNATGNGARTAHIGRIDLAVMFGNPARDCSGNGICKVVPRDLMNLEQEACRIVTATLHWRTDYQQVKLIVERAKVCTRRLAYWQDTGTLNLAGDFALPLWLSDRIGSRLIIPAGQYPFDFTDSTSLSLTFSCTVAQAPFSASWGHCA